MSTDVPAAATQTFAHHAQSTHSRLQHPCSRSTHFRNLSPSNETSQALRLWSKRLSSWRQQQAGQTGQPPISSQLDFLPRSRLRTPKHTLCSSPFLQAPSLMQSD